MRSRRIGHLAFAALLMTSSAGHTTEYWGKFRGDLEGKFVDVKPRPSFKLAKNFEFDDPNGLNWAVPKDSEVDGASIPQAFWSIIGGPFEGPYLKASVIHDHYCDKKTRTAHDTHRNFYYGMRANGVPEWKAKLMHWAVATFGPDWKLVPRVVNKLACATAGGRTTCASTASVEQRLEVSAGPNLEDPQVLALALGKLAATAKTLRTSEGTVLDVGTQGLVDASLESVEANARNYRTLFASANLSERSGELGVLANPNLSDIDEIPVWSGNKLPSASEAKSYQDFIIAGDKSEGFTLDRGGVEAIEKDLDIQAIGSNANFTLPS